MKRIIVFCFLLIFVITGCQQSVEKLLKQERYEEAYKICKTNDEKVLVLNTLVEKKEIFRAANLVVNDEDEVNYRFNSLKNDVAKNLLTCSYTTIGNGFNDVVLNLVISPKKGYEKLSFSNTPELEIKYEMDMANDGTWLPVSISAVYGDTIKKYVVLGKHGEFEEGLKFRDLVYYDLTNDEAVMNIYNSRGITKSDLRKYLYSISRFRIKTVELGY